MTTDGDYQYEIDDSNVVKMYLRGDHIWTSRAYRLRCQAEAQAKEYIRKERGEDKPLEGSITLVVQKLSIDPNTFFGGIKHG